MIIIKDGINQSLNKDKLKLNLNPKGPPWANPKFVGKATKNAVKEEKELPKI